MGAPQWLFLIWMAAEILFVASRHGKPKSQRYSLAVSVIGAALMIALLSWGGFFGAD